jgi:predicted glycoside hydrolase/deacetylase ChbG (UPF0249 family)
MRHNARIAGGQPVRHVVLHADDFGMNRAVTGGILRAFTDGLLTSTSILANAPDAERAVRQFKSLQARRAPGTFVFAPAREMLDDAAQPLDLGVHLNLSQGRPLTGEKFPAQLLDRHGRFPGIGRLFAHMLRRPRQVRRPIHTELAAQIDWLVQHGLRPTHLNGHQFAELLPGVSEAVILLAKQFNIPHVRVALERRLAASTLAAAPRPATWMLAHVKRCFAKRFRSLVDSAGISHPDVFFGTAHAGRIDLATLARYVRGTRAGELVEIGFHPALPASIRAWTAGGAAEQTAGWDDGWGDPLAATRPAELACLCDRRLAILLRRHGMRLTRIAVSARSQSHGPFDRCKAA